MFDVEGGVVDDVIDSRRLLSLSTKFKHLLCGVLYGSEGSIKIFNFDSSFYLENKSPETHQQVPNPTTVPRCFKRKSNPILFIIETAARRRLKRNSIDGKRANDHGGCFYK